MSAACSPLLGGLFSLHRTSKQPKEILFLNVIFVFAFLGLDTFLRFSEACHICIDSSHVINSNLLSLHKCHLSQTFIQKYKNEEPQKEIVINYQLESILPLKQINSSESLIVITMLMMILGISNQH